MNSVDIRTVSFYKSLKLRSSTPVEPRPEIAIAGKSNSGKSSLINYLCGRKKLAYVGKHPGKTRLVNYFLINGAFYLVDLPGYGYASVSKNELKAWSSMMDSFFSDSVGKLRGILICSDIRRDPSEQDLQMIEWAVYYDIPRLYVATKSDKVAKSKRPQNLARITRCIKEALGPDVEVQICAVSAAERFGADKVLEHVSQMLEEEPLPDAAQDENA